MHRPFRPDGPGGRGKLRGHRSRKQCMKPNTPKEARLLGLVYRGRQGLAQQRQDFSDLLYV